MSASNPGWITRANRIAVKLPMVMVLGMVFTMNYEVVSRYFLNNPTRWSVEVSSGLLVYTAFLSFGWALADEGHVRIDSVLRYLRPKALFSIEIFASLVILAFCLVLFWRTGVETIQSLIQGYRSDSPLAIPLFPVLVAMPVGSLLISLQAINRLVKFARKLALEFKPGTSLETEDK